MTSLVVALGYGDGTGGGSVVLNWPVIVLGVVLVAGITVYRLRKR